MIKRKANQELENFKRDHADEYRVYTSIAADLQHEVSRATVSEADVAKAKVIETMMVEAGVPFVGEDTEAFKNMCRRWYRAFIRNKDHGYIRGLNEADKILCTG